MNYLDESTQKIKVHKEQLKHVVMDLGKANEEILLVKGRNFKINQRLVNFVETKDAPYTGYIPQLMDAKLKPILLELNVIFLIMSRRATSQQGDKEEYF